MNQASDIEMLEKRGIVAKDWRQQFPHDATPYTSTSVFLVRKGNPKNIKDWDDLIRENVTFFILNQKVTGIGGYTYLALWGLQFVTLGTEDAPKNLVGDLLINVP